MGRILLVRLGSIRKKWLAAVLCIALFTGCGGGFGFESVTEEQNVQEIAGNSMGAAQNGQEETGYSTHFVNLPSDEWMALPCITARGLYYVAETVDEENYVHQKLKFCTYDVLDIPEGEDQNAPRELVLSSTEEESDKPVGGSVKAVFPGADDTLYLIWCMDNPTHDMFLTQYDGENGLVFSANINKAVNAIGGYRVQAAAGGDYIYLWDQGKAVAMKKDGDFAPAFTFDTGDWYLLLGNGETAWGIDHSGEHTLVSRLGERAEPEDSFELEEPVSIGGMTQEGDLLLGGGQNLYRVRVTESDQNQDKAAETRAERIFGWTDYGIVPSSVEAIYGADKGLVAVTQDNEEKCLVTFRETADGKPLEKTEIVLATMDKYNPALQRLIVEFVRENPQYRIQIMDLFDGEQWLEWDERMDRLNQKILNGNAPDLIDLKGIDWQNYLEKGVLEDLNLYLAQSRVLDRELFYESVLEKQETDGKLAAIPYHFALSLYRGKEEHFKDLISWTNEDVVKKIEEYPYATLIDAGYTMAGIGFMTGGGLDQFIDYENRTCHFNTPEFIMMLEVSRKMKPLEALRNVNGSVDDILIDELGSDRLLLENVYLNDIYSVPYAKKMGKYSMRLVGYPTEDGAGTAHMTCSECYGICSAGKEKEAAWEFLEYCMSHQGENGNYYLTNQFYTKKSAMEQAIREAMTPAYKTDSQGNLRLDGEGNPIEIPKKRINSTSIYAVSQEDVEELLYWIEHSTRQLYSEEKGQEDVILAEEVAAYYAGQKSAAEVAEIIDRRISLYLAE